MKMTESGLPFSKDILDLNPELAHFISVVREKKDLPIDHAFGNEEIKFNPEDWEGPQDFKKE